LKLIQLNSYLFPGSFKNPNANYKESMSKEKGEEKQNAKNTKTRQVI
jgi:hypothetical protein